MARRINFDFLGGALYDATSPLPAPASAYTTTILSTSSSPSSSSSSSAHPGTTADHSLLANLIARVICAVVGTALSWVPFRLLLRNGELAAVVLIAAVAAMNLITVANSLIWRTDDWTAWWDGAGLCDLEVYAAAPLDTAYAAAIFALMRHLAGQMRAAVATADGSPEARRRRRRKMLVQAAIIFPVPLFQLAFTYFDLAQRYLIVTLIGCSAVFDNSLPTNLVYDIPPAIFAVAAVPYAVLTFRRFWRIRKETRAVLGDSNATSARSRRPRPSLRLYLMCLSILVAYFPVMGVYLAANVAATLHPRRTYDYHRVHFAQTPYPWGSILFVPSWLVPSLVLNQPWIPIATSAAIVGFFGTGAEAVATYRWYAGAVLGLGRRCCPGLVGSKSGNSRGDGGKKTSAKKESTGWWRKWFSRDRERAGSRKRILDSTDEAAHGSGNDSPSPRDNRPLSPLYVPKRGPILPTIEPPYQHASPSPTQAHPYLSSPLAASTPAPTPSTGPPAIPPRDSSLRWRFVFRRPALPSISIPSVRLPSLPESISGSLSSLASRSPISPRGGGFGFGFGLGFRKASGDRGVEGAGDTKEDSSRGKGNGTVCTDSPGGRSFSYPFSSYHSRLGRIGGGRRGGGGRDGENENDGNNDDFIPMLPLHTFNVPALPPRTAAAAAASRAAVDALPDADSSNSRFPRFRPGPGSHTERDNTDGVSTNTTDSSSAQYIRIPIAPAIPSSSSSSSPSPTTITVPPRLHGRTPHQGYNSGYTHTHTRTRARGTTTDDGFERASVVGGGGGGDGSAITTVTTTTMMSTMTGENDAIPGTTTVITGGNGNRNRNKEKDGKDKTPSLEASSSVAATAGSASASASASGSLRSDARKRKRGLT
ncbi:pheromone A receptor-domain-containing protein [Biscogniauxia marginata]|nr:pheromone A receptor-domain-containing protein [Biscogniauxia marginata]